jgi:hypothetical protein
MVKLGQVMRRILSMTASGSNIVFQSGLISTGNAQAIALLPSSEN